MKKIHFWSLMLSIVLFGFSSCLKDDCKSTYEYDQFEPVYSTLEEIFADFTIKSPQKLNNPGKIYSYDDWLFVNENMEGIHIINNKNPVAPVNIGFIPIQGNVDMAVSDHILYADNYSNLMSIDIKNPAAPILVDFKPDVLTGYKSLQTTKYITKYSKTRIKMEYPCEHDQYMFCEGDVINIKVGTAAGNSSKGSSGPGIGGSMARFTITKGNLYAVNYAQLLTFDLSNPIKPEMKSSQEVGWNIETIFPYEDLLFIGSMSGMYTYSLSDPIHPTFVSKFAHANSCDPVFVSNTVAYVTLRNGTACNSFSNQLDIIDLKDLTHPVLKNTYPMKNPHGLSIAGDKMIICEGDFGFKTIQVKKEFEITEIRHYQHHAAFDVILLSENLALIIGKDGLFQYNVTQLDNVKLLSKL